VQEQGRRRGARDREGALHPRHVPREDRRVAASRGLAALGGRDPFALLRDDLKRRALAFARASITCAALAACTGSGSKAPAPSGSTTHVERAPGRYLALGDSFTIGTGGAPAQSFAARLADRWASSGCPLTLENVAVNGYTTDDLIERELPSLASFHPTFVTIAIGANDIVRGRSLAEYRQNVGRILDAAKDSGARVVVLPQPDWSRSPTAASFGTQPALAASIAAFNGVLAAEARARGATFVDLSPLMQQQALEHQLASDGLHPSIEAYDAWAAELARLLPSPCAP
jgi:lysophospholipase L1-like esterase